MKKVSIRGGEVLSGAESPVVAHCVERVEGFLEGQERQNDTQNVVWQGQMRFWFFV